MNKRIVGIDLGTTHSLVAVVADGRARCLSVDVSGTSLLKSAVAFAAGEVAAVGNSAAALAAERPGDVVFSIKRLMGRKPADLDPAFVARLPYRLTDDKNVARLQVGGKAYSPPEISALILKQLGRVAEAELGESIERAVVTVPAYFDEGQRQATKDAGKLAGLEVARLVNEPTAAALAYGLHERQQGTVAVYDLGGGTFDVSILRLERGIFQVLATSGNTHLGGDDFDQALADLLVAKGAPAADQAAHARLLRTAERLKRALSDTESVSEGGLSVSRGEFEAASHQLIEATLEPCKTALADAKLSVADLDEVILVGGATRMPMVRAAVERFFGRAPLCSLDPDEVVALGAAVQADILMGNNRELLLVDVTPLSLGVETMGGAVAKLIHRNSTIPTSAQEVFTTYQDHQNAVDFHIVQGERELARDCRSLARFKLRGIPAMPAGMARVVVNFVINTDGLLEVEAKEINSGASAHVEVKPSYGLTDDEVENMLLALLEHAEQDLEERLLVEVRVEAERVLAATKKALAEDGALLSAEERAEIDGYIANLQSKLSEPDRHSMAAAMDSLDQATSAFAERRMNRSIAQVLEHKAIVDL